MCNLSEGIEKRGITIGEARGEARGITIGEARGKAKEHDDVTIQHLTTLMRKSGLSLDAVMDMLDIPIADRPRYAAIIEKNTH